jgi:hypothetical protein
MKDAGIDPNKPPPAPGTDLALATAPDGAYVCPMDKDVRSDAPGVCPRCGMTLVKGVMDTLEYPVRISTTPSLLAPGADARLTFHVTDPRTEQPVTRFLVAHEKLYHFFVVSQDLKYFQHIHPERSTPDEDFHLDLRFPKAGLYRVLSDFYPEGGTPQLIINTIAVPGPDLNLEIPRLTADIGPQKGVTVTAEIELTPRRVVAGEKSLMLLRISPGDGLEPYLGAMAHMLIGSADLIDMIHNHPAQVAGPSMQFNMIYPRPGVYRVWIQVQRKGVVNTVAFNVPVEPAT